MIGFAMAVIADDAADAVIPKLYPLGPEDGAVPTPTPVPPTPNPLPVIVVVVELPKLEGGGNGPVDDDGPPMVADVVVIVVELPLVAETMEVSGVV